MFLQAQTRLILAQVVIVDRAVGLGAGGVGARALERGCRLRSKLWARRVRGEILRGWKRAGGKGGGMVAVDTLTQA